MKRPAYQWNIEDADGDEVFLLMSYEQQGIFHRLLDRQWKEGSIPADPKQIFALLPKLKSFQRFQSQLWPLISAKFQSQTLNGVARLQNSRLEKYRRELDDFTQIQAQKGKAGAEKRWQGHSRAISTGIDRAWPLDGTKTRTKTKTTNPTGGDVVVTPIRTPAPSTTRTPDPPTPTDTNSANGGQRTAALTAGLKEHRNHACCGIVCLHASQFDEFLRRSRQHGDPDRYVRNFFREWDERYSRGDRKDAAIAADTFDFWRDRWKETHPQEAKAAGETAEQILARRKALGI